LLYYTCLTNSSSVIFDDDLGIINYYFYLVPGEGSGSIGITPRTVYSSVPPSYSCLDYKILS
jgi:hypothetical protein